MEKLVLIDGNSLINRAFYAMPLLTTKDGLFTNAVYGFMNMFFKMLSEEKPTYVAVAFDVKAPTFRHKMFSEYKGTRKPMPEELRPQIPLLKDLLTLMGVTVIEKPGSEADDIIGTIAKHTDIKTVIFTGDKDSFQLVDEQTEVHFTRRGITETEIYDNENFKEKMGITPKQIIDLKSLMGDSSDNIPGVKGIGEKTALTLLADYESLEGVYQNVDKIRGKTQEKLLLNKDAAFLSKTLATIDCDCDVLTDVSKMTISLPFSMEVKKKFTELEFKTLIKKDDWFDENDSMVFSPTDEKPIETTTVQSLSEIDLNAFSYPLAIVIGERAVFLSDGSSETVIPVRRELLDDGFLLSEAIEALKTVFTQDKPIIVFGKKELRHFLKNTIGVDLCAPTEDVSIMKYLCDFVGKDEKLIEVITEYNLSESRPAASLYTIYIDLLKSLKDSQMESLYRDVELPLADVLFDMEVSGFKVDFDALCEAGEKYRSLIIELEKEFHALANDQTVNINSPKQLGELLFEKLKIGKGKKTKTGYSTSAEVLESFEDAHPIVPVILRHRQLQKIQSTYIEGFKPLIDKRTGLIHTSFNQTVTATGRLSSKEPNLQNIPVRDDESREIRKFFVPKSNDRVLVGADYSQIELRLLAAFSGCKALIDAYSQGKDIHAATAAKVFGVPIESVTPRMRSDAKAVNFGIIYGMSEYGLAKNLKVSAVEARNYIATYFKEYPEIKDYMDANVAFAKENGYAKTLLGRRRYIRELSSSNYNLRLFGERVAMNMPLQGSSADIIKLAMLGVSKRLKEEGLKSELILQVHDELIVDAFIDEKERVEKILIEEMEGAANLSVRLTVSPGSGKTWFDAK